VSLISFSGVGKEGGDAGGGEEGAGGGGTCLFPRLARDFRLRSLVILGMDCPVLVPSLTLKTEEFSAFLFSWAMPLLFSFSFIISGKGQEN